MISLGWWGVLAGHAVHMCRETAERSSIQSSPSLSTRHYPYKRIVTMFKKDIQSDAKAKTKVRPYLP